MYHAAVTPAVITTATKNTKMMSRIGDLPPGCLERGIGERSAEHCDQLHRTGMGWLIRGGRIGGPGRRGDPLGVAAGIVATAALPSAQPPPFTAATIRNQSLQGQGEGRSQSQSR